MTAEGQVCSFTGRLLTCTEYRGRPQFSARDSDKKVRAIQVHRFAAYQIFGVDALLPFTVVKHRDNNWSNNIVDNLYLSSRTVDSRPHRRLTQEQATELRTDRSEGMLYRELVAKYGIKPSAIRKIIDWKTYV